MAGIPHMECITAALKNGTVDAREKTLDLRDEVEALRHVVCRLLTRRNEVEFKLGDGWELRDELWTYVPGSDAVLAYLNEAIGE